MEIKITPDEIKKFSFSKNFRGYAPSEVHAFLNEIAVVIHELQQKNAHQEKEIAEFQSQIANMEQQKELLRNTLLLAEKLKNETITTAKNEAANIIRDAEVTARAKVKKAKDYLNMLEHDFINLKERKKQFLIQFQSQLLTMQEFLEKEKSTSTNTTDASQQKLHIISEKKDEHITE